MLGGADRLDDLDLLVAHPVGVERGRRLHAHVGQQLHHVVLHEVAQRPRSVVVTGAGPDPDVLDRRDLHVVDVVAIPHRLEHRVGEAERHDVLDGLLAQVVIDAKDLGLLKDRQHGLVELARGGEVVSERLLDHHPGVSVLGPVEVVLAECVDDHREELGGRRQVEDAVEDDPGLIVVLADRLAQRLVDRGVVEDARDVLGPLEQRVEHLGLRRCSRVLLDGLLHLHPEVLVRLLRARDPDQVEPLGQRPLVGQVVERGQQLAVREVARGAEDRQRRRMDGQPFQPLDEGVLLLLGPGRGGHRSRPQTFLTAWPPNWLRSAAFTRAAKSACPREAKRA